jgi:uncharacterized Zn finger protein
MAELPTLTEADVRQRIDTRSFQRGESYYRGGAILHPRIQGTMLKAECMGSRPQPYRVELTFDESGNMWGSCSCPVGGGGRCKHAAALLLTWVHEPETFVKYESLHTSLERRSKDELITLITKMLDRYPDLENLFELQALGQMPPSERLDPAMIRGQVKRALFSGEGNWYTGYQDLNELIGIGDSFAERDDWANAITVYETVSQAILEEYGAMHDEEGEYKGLVNACVSGLGMALDNVEDATQRTQILRTLFEIYSWDIDFGGIDMGYEALPLIIELATPEERHKVADWVRDKIANIEGGTFDTYRRQAYGIFLLNLEADTLTDEEFLEICRQTGHLGALVERLLKLDRVDEALAEARQASAYACLNLADRFVDYGHDELALAFIQERAETEQMPGFKTWLKKYAEAHDQPETALALAQEIFWQNPSLQGYQELQRLAEPVEQWETLREATLKRLCAEHGYLLVEIYLAEGHGDLALQTFKTLEKHPSQWGWGLGGLHLRVAEAVEATQPREAIAIYMQAVTRLINARGRSNYATAAQHLLRVRKLYKQMDETEAWETLIAGLRDEHSRLPALQDELDKAGVEN